MDPLQFVPAEEADDSITQDAEGNYVPGGLGLEDADLSGEHSTSSFTPIGKPHPLLFKTCLLLV